VGATELGLLLLVGSDAVLAGLVLTLVGRPSRALGPLCSLTGQRADWDAGRLGEADEARLLLLADRLRLPALIGLFAWSFLVGGVLAAAGRVALPIAAG
jgi:hypothetical protein